MSWTPPTPQDHLDRMRRDAPLVAGAELASFDATVPGCPDWTVRDLVAHVGMIHGWCAGNVRMLAPMREHVELDPPVDDGELARWAREQASELVAALEATDPDAPMWTHVGAGRAGYWFRRMAHETGVHLLDLADATQAPGPAADPRNAADGVDEFLDVYATRRDRHGHLRGSGERLVLQATDADASWLVRCEPSGGVVARLDGAHPDPEVPRIGLSAVGLLRLVWGRGTAVAATQEGPPAEAAIVLGRLRATAI